jgi:hypothetical protein
MAFKLDKQEIARRERLVGELTEARGKLQDAVSVFNAAVEELKAPLLAALESYNEVIEETRGFVEDIASAADGQFDDKSEKWQEGDKGQQVREWIDAWQNEPFDAIELSFPEELALEDEESDHDGRLENLPEAADA